MAVGIVLLLVSPIISWNRVARWYQFVYWYQYRTDSQLMYDLKHGYGLPAPANNPLEVIRGHGWLGEEVDLARAALHELLKRDAAGKLSPANRHEIDEIAIANLYAPVTGPARIYLNEELAKRLSDGKLTRQEQATILNRAVTLTVTPWPVVAQWDAVPILISAKTCLPWGTEEHFMVDLSYPSLQIDGKDASWSKNWWQPASDTMVGGGTRPLTRYISFTALGTHRIYLDVQIDIRDPSGQRIHRERRTFNVTFQEIKPPLTVELVRLINDPMHEAGHYLSTGWLRTLILRGKTPVAELALNELIRREQLGELPSEEHDALVEQLLAIQADRSHPWSGKFGDYIESLHDARRLSDANWQRYGRQQLAYSFRVRSEIAQGQPLPVEIITKARRGDSEESPFYACQWSLKTFVYDGVWRSIQLAMWDGKTGDDVYVVPRSGNEYGRLRNAIIPHAELGRHVLSATLDLTWLYSPQGVVIPAEFDLGRVEFTVVPPSENRVRLIDAPDLAEQIGKCIAIDRPVHQPDESVTTSIEIHRPPVDVAFDVYLEVGGREWGLGELFAPKGGDSDSNYGSFSVKDGMHVPASGLIFHFRPDPKLALRTVALHECWNGEVTIGPLNDWQMSRQ